MTPPNWKLGLAKELLDEDSDIEVFVPDDLQGELRAVLQPYTGTGASLKSLRYSGLQLAGRPTLEGYADLELSRQDFDQHRTRIQELAKSLPFEPRIRISDTLVGVTLDTRIRGEYRQVEASSFARWMLASGNIDRRLETGSPAQQILGPTVLAYAAEYPETTFADATKTLSEEIAKARESRKLALLGLEVSPERAVLFGPLFTLLLVLFLLVHLGHANTATDEDGSLQAFPWVGLFYGRLARGILASSLILLPLLVNTWLIVSTRSFTLVGSALTLGAIPIGYLAFRSSSRLRFRKVP
ncbi:MAG: hypothetical protein KDD47_18210 [Acidobacteria bacterium]|nr:hypothetical protein [Acidobacteriota bacterium]